MEILFFYLFGGIKEEKLHRKHYWRTGGIGMPFVQRSHPFHGLPHLHCAHAHT